MIARLLNWLFPRRAPKRAVGIYRPDEDFDDEVFFHRFEALLARIDEDGGQLK